MTTDMQNHHSQAGISLLEVKLSLSIIAVILIMATTYYTIASKKQNISHAVDEISALVIAVQNWDSGNSNYSGIGNASQGILNLYNAGLIANNSDLKLTTTNGNVAAAILYNPWNQPITVAGAVGQATIATTLPSADVCNAVKINFSGSSCDTSNNFTYIIQ